MYTILAIHPRLNCTQVETWLRRRHSPRIGYSRELSYCTWSAGPCLPCVISVMSVFCIHLVIYQQQLRLLEARSWAAPWQGRRYSTSSSWQALRPSQYKSSHTHPFPPARQGRTPCWDNSLRPSASVGYPLAVFNPCLWRSGTFRVDSHWMY